MNIWDTLEISPNASIKEIKRAYSKKVKQHKPEKDPVGYQQIREAYDLAVNLAKSQKSSDQQSVNSEPQIDLSIFEQVESEPANDAFDTTTNEVEVFEIESDVETFEVETSPPPEPEPEYAEEDLEVQEDHRDDEDEDEDEEPGEYFEEEDYDEEEEPPCPEEQANEDLENLESILISQGEEPAKEYLDTLLKSEFYQNESSRDALELCIFSWAGNWEQDFEPYSFFYYVIDVFKWKGSGYKDMYYWGLHFLEKRLEAAKAKHE